MKFSSDKSVSRLVALMNNQMAHSKVTRGSYVEYTVSLGDNAISFIFMDEYTVVTTPDHTYVIMFSQDDFGKVNLSTPEVRELVIDELTTMLLGEKKDLYCHDKNGKAVSYTNDVTLWYKSFEALQYFLAERNLLGGILDSDIQDGKE